MLGCPRCGAPVVAAGGERAVRLPSCHRTRTRTRPGPDQDQDQDQDQGQDQDQDQDQDQGPPGRPDADRRARRGAAPGRW
ncbi:hypothetical protein [Kitasatospora sp. NPDC005748]|uniref:hypothetical protein n=1 Tax=Kitasatospora sp. NPDC005748 TaxID=3157063 RepID=UPI0033CB4262